MPKIVTQALNPYEITLMRKTMSNHQNWNNEVFKEITGIDAEKECAEC
jgi:hypothetical protein